ncbi:MAG: dTDP-4-dehydrorhamnose 3,5-epimerase [Phycisphaerae bacterium]|nr:dTDP-4-dehydrorhamnose 3,5-epimerase [Phycisphaerae bacterium]
MKVIQTAIEGVVILEPQMFADHRGFFMETWNRQRYTQAGVDADFVQDNLSFSHRGVLRGLHFQHPQGQGKLVQVLEGEVFDAAVDIRRGSPTFGQAVTCRLSADNRRQFYVPAGFAHGFCVLSQTALFSYKCTDFYQPHYEGGILWNDPSLGIDWPIDQPILSEKDSRLPLLSQIAPERLPAYRG